MRLHELSVSEEIEAAVIKAYDEGWSRKDILAVFVEYLHQYEEVEQ